MNDHDNTYAHTMTSLEKRLDVKSDLMMRKLDAILSGSNREERSAPRSAHAMQMVETETEHAAMPGPSKARERVMKLSIEERPGAAPSRPG